VSFVLLFLAVCHETQGGPGAQWLRPNAPGAILTVCPKSPSPPPPFSETIPLPRMAPDELQRIAVNYLNLARRRPSGEVFPFTTDAIAQIAEYAYCIPRQFNLICEKIMRRGAMNGVAQIDPPTFAALWKTVQEEFALELTPEVRRLLYIARRSGGLSPDVDDATLEQLEAETFVELLPLLKALEGDLLIRQEDGRLLPSAMLPDEE